MYQPQQVWTAPPAPPTGFRGGSWLPKAGFVIAGAVAGAVITFAINAGAASTSSPSSETLAVSSALVLGQRSRILAGFGGLSGGAALLPGRHASAGASERTDDQPSRHHGCAVR